MQHGSMDAVPIPYRWGIYSSVGVDILYAVNDVYVTIQGEGCMTGVPMVLVRLQGCPVGCPFCDTKETWGQDWEQRVDSIDLALGTNAQWATAGTQAIVEQVEKARAGTQVQWVLLTGGEPALNDLRPLVAALHDAGLKVAIETSGTALGHVDAGIDWIAVSPKIGMPGGKACLPAAVNVADEIKHVVGKQADIDKLCELLMLCTLKDSVTICLQPVSQSEKATQLCVKTVQKMGWRLSLQIHKYIEQR